MTDHCPFRYKGDLVVVESGLSQIQLKTIEEVEPSTQEQWVFQCTSEVQQQKEVRDKDSDLEEVTSVQDQSVDLV